MITSKPFLNYHICFKFQATAREILTLRIREGFSFIRFAFTTCSNYHFRSGFFFLPSLLYPLLHFFSLLLMQITLKHFSLNFLLKNYTLSAKRLIFLFWNIILLMKCLAMLFIGMAIALHCFCRFWNIAAGKYLPL